MIQLLFTQTYAASPSGCCEAFWAGVLCRGLLSDVASRDDPQPPATNAATAIPRQQTPIPQVSNPASDRRGFDEMTLEDVAGNPLRVPTSAFSSAHAAVDQLLPNTPAPQGPTPEDAAMFAGFDIDLTSSPRSGRRDV